MKLAYDTYIPQDESSSHLPPIILVHSMFENKNTWRSLGQPLATQTGRKVYAIDNRNFGESPYTNDFNYSVMVEDLHEFLGDHAISRSILIGHSMGGKIVLEFTLKHPEMVEMLITEDSPVKELHQRDTNLLTLGLKLVREMLDFLKVFRTKEEAENYIRSIGHTFSNFLKVKPEIVNSYNFDLLPLKWNGQTFEIDINVETVANAVFSNKMQQKLTGKFEGNALFLYGTTSQFKVDKDLLVEKLFPNAIKVGIEDAGHFIHEVAPQEFLREVVHFINTAQELKSKY